MARTSIRTLAVALAAAVVAAPTAFAQPADAPPSVTKAAVKAQQRQDLRHLRAGHGSYTPGSSAIDRARLRRTQGPPTWPVNPEPVRPAPAVHASEPGGINWTTIGLGIAGGLLALGGIAAVARRGRVGHARVAV